MANKQLADYISKGIASGYRPEQMRQSLIQSGWDAAEVDDALSSLGQSSQAPSPAPPAPQPKKGMGKGTKILIAVIVVAVVLMVILFVALFFMASIFALGVFNPAAFTSSDSSKAVASGFSGFSVSENETKVNSTGILITIKNAAGNGMRLESAVATYESQTWTNTSSLEDMDANGQQTIYLSGTGGPAPGMEYDVSVRIVYKNLNTGTSGFTSTGTVTGTA